MSRDAAEGMLPRRPASILSRCAKSARRSFPPGKGRKEPNATRPVFSQPYIMTTAFSFKNTPYTELLFPFHTSRRFDFVLSITRHNVDCGHRAWGKRPSRTSGGIRAQGQLHIRSLPHRMERLPVSALRPSKRHLHRSICLGDGNPHVSGHPVEAMVVHGLHEHRLCEWYHRLRSQNHDVLQPLELRGLHDPNQYVPPHPIRDVVLPADLLPLKVCITTGPVYYCAAIYITLSISYVPVHCSSPVPSPVQPKVTALSFCNALFFTVRPGVVENFCLRGANPVPPPESTTSPPPSPASNPSSSTGSSSPATSSRSSSKAPAAESPPPPPARGKSASISPSPGWPSRSSPSSSSVASWGITYFGTSGRCIRGR